MSTVMSGHDAVGTSKPPQVMLSSMPKTGTCLPSISCIEGAAAPAVGNPPRRAPVLNFSGVEDFIRAMSNGGDVPPGLLRLLQQQQQQQPTTTTPTADVQEGRSGAVVDGRAALVASTDDGVLSATARSCTSRAVEARENWATRTARSPLEKRLRQYSGDGHDDTARCAPNVEYPSTISGDTVLLGPIAVPHADEDDEGHAPATVTGDLFPDAPSPTHPSVSFDHRIKKIVSLYNTSATDSGGDATVSRRRPVLVNSLTWPSSVTEMGSSCISASASQLPVTRLQLGEDSTAQHPRAAQEAVPLSNAADPSTANEEAATPLHLGTVEEGRVKSFHWGTPLSHSRLPAVQRREAWEPWPPVPSFDMLSPHPSRPTVVSPSANSLSSYPMGWKHSTGVESHRMGGKTPSWRCGSGYSGGSYLMASDSSFVCGESYHCARSNYFSLGTDIEPPLTAGVVWMGSFSSPSPSFSFPFLGGAAVGSSITMTSPSDYGFEAESMRTTAAA